MQNIYNVLNAQDKNYIYRYITNYGIPAKDYIGNDIWLKGWAENKGELYKMLGNNLTYSFDFSYGKSDEEKRIVVNNLFSTDKHKEMSAWYYRVMTELMSKEYDSFRNEKDKDKDDENSSLKRISNYSFHANVSLMDFAFKTPLPLTIKRSKTELKKGVNLTKGCSIMKAFKKLLDYYDIDTEYYEQFRIFMSMINNDGISNAKVTLSIHPLDFMTMSDNNSNWSSCMSWKTNGCYHIGTIEMMNSPYVLVAYIENSDPFTLVDDITWNNKRWRQLFYINDDIEISGKAYPYSCDALSKKILDVIAELSKKNLHRTYKTGIQKYEDMCDSFEINGQDFSNFCENEYIDEYIYEHIPENGDILATGIMYNDFYNDNHYTYFCRRNPHTKIRVINLNEEPARCLKCNNDLSTWEHMSSDFKEGYEDDFNSRYENSCYPICTDCKSDYECEQCWNTNPFCIEYEGEKYCKDCAHATYICPCCKTPVKNVEITYDKSLNIMVLKNSVDTYDMDYWKKYYRAQYDCMFGEEDKIDYDFDIIKICENCYKKLYEDNKINVKLIIGEKEEKNDAYFLNRVSFNVRIAKERYGIESVKYNNEEILLKDLCKDIFSSPKYLFKIMAYVNIDTFPDYQDYCLPITVEQAIKETK